MQRHEYDVLVVGSSIERTYWHDLLQFAEVGLAAAPMAYGIHQCDDATVHDATVHDATVHDATVHDATEWHNATECHKPLRLRDAQRPAHCVLSD